MMFSKKLAAPVLLAATVGGPYVASNGPKWIQSGEPSTTAAQPSAPWSPLPGLPVPSSPGSDGSWPSWPVTPPPQPTAAQSLKPPQAPGSTIYPAETPLEGLRTYSLAEVLRFDISREWVYQQWARKSTALAELDLYGIRVPLVTGTQLHDLAGSLTYYFGLDGRVKRISFRGRTGDTTQLATLMAQQYGLVPQTTVMSGEQLLQRREGEDLISELRTRPAPVLWANSPHDSFTVELELQDPASARPLASLAAAPLPPAPPASATGPAAPPEGAATAAAQPNQGPAPAAAAPEPLGWKALFPRSRIPKAQVKNLDQGNLYQ